MRETSPRSGSVTIVSSISSPGSPQRLMLQLTTATTTPPPLLLLLGEGSAISTNLSLPSAAATEAVKPSAVVPTHREVLMKLAQIPDMHQWFDDVHGTGHQYRQQKAVVPHTTHHQQHHYPTVSIAIGVTLNPFF